MNETRDLLERVGDRFAFPADAFERLEHRRDRKRTNRRIAAGAAGIAVFAALVFALARATWSDSAPRPGEPHRARPRRSVSSSRATRSCVRTRSSSPITARSRRFDLETLDRRTLVTCEYPCIFFPEAAASADDGWLAYTIETCLGALPCEADAGLWVENDLGERRQLIQSCDPDLCFSLVWAWSPTSPTLAVAVPAGAPSGPRSLFLVDPATGSRTELAHPPMDVVTLAWSPDGSQIAYAGAGTSTSFPSTEEHRRCWRRGSEPLWSPDGSHVAVTVQGGISSWPPTDRTRS